MPLEGEFARVKNVLTISSHVNHGYVGNDALQFPLNLRDWNVDCIHTTNFSTHPGHGMGAFTGDKSDSKDVLNLYRGLKKYELTHDAIIIGYIGTKENLDVVFNDILIEASNADDKPFIIIDPIMGDNGKVYVAPGIVDGYKSFFGKNVIDVDLLTPNQFEFETLAGTKVDSLDSLKESLDKFCELYPRIKNLVITSVQFGDGNMYCVGNSNGKLFYYQVNEVKAVFSGSGDLFLGLLMDEFIKSNFNLEYSLGKTLLTVENVLQLTYKLSKDDHSIPKREVDGKMYIPDLKIIESKSLLLSEDGNNLPMLHSIN